MKWNMADLPVFVAVVEKGGISAAARSLRMPKSSVSRFIQRLEEDLKVRLLERNSRQMRMTSEGEIFYKHCQLIMEQIEAADAHMNGLTHTPSGELNISLPMAFSRHVLAGHLQRFHQQYPDIQLNIQVSPVAVDLIGEHIDLAVQVGELPDSELIAVPLFETPLVWVASPTQYERGHRFSNLAALVNAVQVCERRYNRTPLAVRYQGERERIELDASIETIDPIMVRDTIVAGCGIGLLPLLYCRELIDQGKLVTVAPDVMLDQVAKASAVYTSRRMLSAKTRLFIEFLRELTDDLQREAGP
jgi:DNA-binding transcriptional LysR family regulator